MKKLIQSFSFAFLFTLFSTLPLSANPNNDYPNVKTLRTEIMALIKKPDLSLLDKQEETVKLSFLVNASKEVVVITADTESEFLEDYIKENLNYRPVKTNYVQLNKIYHIKLVFKKNKS